MCASPLAGLAHLWMSGPIGPMVGSERVRGHSHPALDPSHGTASPAVPALIGSGSPSCSLAQFRNFLELGQEARMELCQISNNPGIFEQAGDIG